MSAMSLPRTRKSVFAPAGQGPRFEAPSGEVFTPIIHSDDVSSAYAISLLEAPPGFSPPRHVHHREDEVFHLLEGQLLIWCDGETYEAGPGDTAVLPKGLPHTWLVTSSVRAKLIVTLCPGGLDRVFARMARTGAKAAPHDLQAIGREFEIELVGPPLENR